MYIFVQLSRRRDVHICTLLRAEKSTIVYTKRDEEEGGNRIVGGGLDLRGFRVRGAFGGVACRGMRQREEIDL